MKGANINVVDRNELMAEADELASMIMESPEIAAYHRAEAAMQAHPEASSLLRRVKELQAQVQEFQARNVPPMHYAYLLEETESLFNKLDTIPEVKEFQRAQSAVNELLQAVTRRLATGVLMQVGDANTDCPDC